MPSQDYAEQLKRQLVFLRNSAAAYDAGHVVEAVRIGVVIRVLCHDTPRSVSLLQHMGQKSSLELVTTAKTVPGHLLATVDFAELMAGITFGNDLVYDPLPKGSPTVPCPSWWDQPVFCRDKVMYTRKDIVLAAANKDGGAHVDAPDENLLALQEGFWNKTTTNADGIKTTVSLSNNHFRMLRRFADELLNSQELIKLTD
ncbi:MAG: hypothetical protein PXX77_10205 [Gallionella sp.]|nr:hypothetical protein [Gallionella sp.]